MFKRTLFATLVAVGLLGVQPLIVNAQTGAQEDPVNRGAWPRQLLRPIPAQAKYFQEREQQLQEEQARAAAGAGADGREDAQNRGAYPRQLLRPIPRLGQYYQDRDRAIRAETTARSGIGFPEGSDQGAYWNFHSR